MTNRLTISPKFITANGSRVGVRYSTGPWVEGVDVGLIKIRPRKGSRFPAELRQAFTVENNSDCREDYFEADSIRILPSHPRYSEIKAAATFEASMVTSLRELAIGSAS